MLLEGRIDDGQRERLTRIALGEMDRLNSTITDLLSFSRPGALNPESFDIHEALRETLDLLRNRDDRKADVEAAFSGPLLFVGDMGKIKDVFWNLGVNALEAMPDGGRLTVDSWRDDSGLHVRFRDTGDGVNQEDKDKIFYPFYTTKETGTGLGLSASYRSVEEHGGTITVERHEEGGAVFVVNLPVRKDG